MDLQEGAEAALGGTEHKARICRRRRGLLRCGEQSQAAPRGTLHASHGATGCLQVGACEAMREVGQRDLPVGLSQGGGGLGSGIPGPCSSATGNPAARQDVGQRLSAGIERR